MDEGSLTVAKPSRDLERTLGLAGGGGHGGAGPGNPKVLQWTSVRRQGF